jgi:hypothetical protein
MILGLPSVCVAQPDVKDLIRQSVENYDRSWREAMHLSYTQQDITCSDGKKETAISQIVPLDGTPYERLISKDGHALSADEQRREDEKFDRELHKREAESPDERRARIQKYEKDRAFIKELPEAYDFKLVGEDTVAGRPAWVVTLTPKPGFVPKTSHADLLKHIEGKLWIDKQDLQWAKAEAHIIDTISIGLILARIAPGAHITLDMTRVSPTLWVAKEITINGEAKVLLVHTKNLNEQLTFTGYHTGKPSGPQVAEK